LVAHTGLPPELTHEVFRLDRAHVLLLPEHPLGSSTEPLPWRLLDGFAIRVPSAQYALQLGSFLEALRCDRGFGFTISTSGSTSLDLSIDQLAQDPDGAQLGFDSFRTADTPAVDRLMVEPGALYAWSVIWRRGNTSSAMSRFLNVVRALSTQRNWMDGAQSADMWIPPEDRASIGFIDS
jgi:hypothetical protein